MKIMLVDDEESMRILIERIVINDGHDFCFARDGLEALEVFAREEPDLLILDVMMPKFNGYEVCQRFRANGVTVPIIFLSAKGEIDDMGAGFGVGGDDYLVKPFSPRELSLRIDARLKQHTRAAVQQKGSIDILGIEVDPKRHRVSIQGRFVDLTPKEFEILHLLISHPGEVFTREQIINEVWGQEYVGELASIAVFVRKIREKIEEDPAHPRYLQTVWRIGYRFGN
ncbi:MAG: response regulator transcription factor [Coriobacteriales bacterium]|jgi:two-component system response regulator VicR|nr:response regulator transcription factor [Coriobacteriales bacterium]